MNIWNFVVKEVKQNLRNFKGMTMMVLFPIVLILVLGTALTGMFDSSSEFKEIEVIYSNQGNGAFSQAFNSFVQKGEDMGIKFIAAQSVEQGMESVKDGKYACFIKADAGGIELTKKDRYGLRADLVESILSTFLQRYNAISAIALHDPAAVGRLARENVSQDNVRLLSLGARKQPGAMDYYAITMLTLIIMYAALTGTYAIRDEKTSKTMNRLLASPARKYEILTGKILGTFLITLLQVSVVILFSKYLFKTYWGSHLGVVLGLVVTEVLMAVSLGIGITFILKNEMAVNSVLNLGIPVLVFLGGGYIPLNSFNKNLLLIENISPVRWMNQAVFRVIYSNDFRLVTPALAINLSLALLFILIASLSIRKEGSI